MAFPGIGRFVSPVDAKAPSPNKEQVMPERNIEALEGTMQYILDHPEEHNQSMWTCGTAMCFAGHATHLYGPEMGWECGRILLRVNGCEEWSKGDSVADTPRLARQVLGLTQAESDMLFEANNTRAQLQLMVKDLVNGDELRTYSEYAREAGL